MQTKPGLTAIAALATLLIIPSIAAYDASVTYRDDTITNDTITDAVTIRNEAYPNGSPATVHANHTRYEPNTTHSHNTSVTINSYTYTDTTNYTVTNTTTKLCTTITTPNKTDTNTSNNHACHTLRTPQNLTEDQHNQSSPNHNTTNTTTNQTAEQNTTEQADDEPTTAETNTAEQPQQDDEPTCPQPVLTAPATTTDTITFFVNATKPTTYWATNPQGNTVKDKITTDNPGDKQFTPDADWTTIHADHPGCDETTTRTVGITTPPTEPYITINDAELNDDLTTTITYHAPDSTTLDITAADTAILETSLPAGTHELTLTAEPPRLPAGILPITASTGDHEDTYRVHTDTKPLQDTYPELIETTYDRTTYYGPTTVYTSLNEPLNGSLTITAGERTMTTNISGAHHETTVIPPSPTSTIGITINNRVGEPLDHAYHRFNLTRRQQPGETTTSTNTSAPTQRVTTPNQTVSQPNSTAQPNITTRSTEQHSESTPYLATTLLATGIGYAAYRAHTTQAI
jgi:hypothetical protein